MPSLPQLSNQACAGSGALRHRLAHPLQVIFVLVLALAAGAGQAAAQGYPAKPIRMIVGSSPGGPIDFAARLSALILTEALGQSVMVENRTGAGGTIGNEFVARAAPDGYTLLTASAATLCVAPSLYPNLPYDALKDFAAITTVANSTFVLVVHPSLPAKTVMEFIALARSRPRQLHFGSAGSGSVTHLAAELFRRMAGIEAVHVPYKGAAPALIDLIGGRLQFTFDSVLTSSPHVKAGKLRALGVTSATRSPVMPELPTIAEAGLPGYEASTWFGLVAPAGTPRDIIAKLNSIMVKSLSSPGTRDRLLAQGLEPVGNTPEQFTQLIRGELPKWAEVVKFSGAKAE